MYNLVERSEYPITPYREKILELVAKNDVVAICAPTGSGKSTQVVQYLRDAGYKKIIVTEPTRTAAASLASRTSEENGTALGDVIGFKTGYDKVYSENTEILYTTEATELMQEFYNTMLDFENCIVILDEAQEGSIPCETLMAWFKKEIEEGHHVKLILMSANMETDKISDFFGTIPVLNIPGKLYEITEYSRRSCDIVPTIVELVNDGRHVLVFEPGKREIDQLIEELNKQNLNVNLLRLHGDLPLSEQQRVFNEPTIPTVVVATNIAQTSLTIPYIDAVVDSGLERRMQKVDGLDTLAIGVISKSDYIQRRGRAGRTKPGVYVWCNDTPIYKLEEYPVPDIYTGSIHQIVLHLASINIDAREIKFLHQPPIEKIEAAQKTLRMLGAFDENNKITECGRIMARLPISVRYARMIVEGQKRDVLSDVVTIAALSEFGGIKASNVSYQNFSKEMKSDLLAELDCFNTVRRRIIDGDINAFDEVNERNYFRVLELRTKISDILYNIYGDVSSSGDRSEIRKSCAAGLVEFLYVRESNGWYSNPNDDYKRKLNLYSATLPSKYLLGLPKNISLAYKGNHGNQILYLISSAVMVDVPLLEDIAPHLIHTKIKNEFKYETNDYLIRTVTLFGDVEIASTERKLNDIDEKRKALSEWLAKVTTTESFFISCKLDKALSKIIYRNQDYLNTPEEAYDFYFNRLQEFSTTSLPNLKKAKNISFLSAK